jgi:protein involved in polysaccharide export with SLBB domain
MPRMLVIEELHVTIRVRADRPRSQVTQLCRLATTPAFRRALVVAARQALALRPGDAVQVSVTR